MLFSFFIKLNSPSFQDFKKDLISKFGFGLNPKTSGDVLEDVKQEADVI